MQVRVSLALSLFIFLVDAKVHIHLTFHVLRWKWSRCKKTV